ncbi:MAG TPA: molybdenum cofactor biosynthesis protein MoaE [Bacteroidales bacterium]|nr:molybdenum cofactor biosynthesis protein MoaE [Bacteroidales bacterium]
MHKFLSEGPLTAEQLSRLMSLMKDRSDTGGHSLFIGQVRADIVNNKSVTAIEYSAYESMVNDEAESIIAQIRTEFSDVKTVEILHSTGIVKAGEVSLAVMVSAGHRQQAIQACSKTVELIKERLPVWKKELLEDNSHIWRENRG